jgi:hypothetical protein
VHGKPIPVKDFVSIVDIVAFVLDACHALIKSIKE